jgi:hypothetical protein
MVSGTFAKYVVQDSATDSARVAKFGVLVNADGNLFSDTYKVSTASDDLGNTPGIKGDSTKAATLTVVSSSITGSTTNHDGLNGSDKVVAPGTQNSTGLTFSVTGKPEVAVKLTFEASGSDVWLGKGTYPNMTNGDTFNDTYEATDTFTAKEAYYPIKYTLKQNGQEVTYTIDKSNSVKLTDVTLSTIINYLNSAYSTKTYAANTDLATEIGSYTLTWSWAYENTSSAQDGTVTAAAVTAGAYDDRDTFMGDLAADKASVNTVVTTVANAAATEIANKEALSEAAAKAENAYVSASEAKADDEAALSQAAVDAAAEYDAVKDNAVVTDVAMPSQVEYTTTGNGNYGTNNTAKDNSYSINANFAISIRVEQVD